MSPILEKGDFANLYFMYYLEYQVSYLLLCFLGYIIYPFFVFVVAPQFVPIKYQKLSTSLLKPQPNPPVVGLTISRPSFILVTVIVRIRISICRTTSSDILVIPPVMCMTAQQYPYPVHNCYV